MNGTQQSSQPSPVTYALRLSKASTGNITQIRSRTGYPFFSFIFHEPVTDKYPSESLAVHVESKSVEAAVPPVKEIKAYTE